jgi:hypothetical protein
MAPNGSSAESSRMYARYKAAGVVNPSVSRKAPRFTLPIGCRRTQGRGSTSANVGDSDVRGLPQVIDPWYELRT